MELLERLEPVDRRLQRNRKSLPAILYQYSSFKKLSISNRSRLTYFPSILT
jgi:hypothetical protein